MRVLVELLDKEPLENLVGSYIFRPDIVVYLCDQTDTGFFKESTIYRLIKQRKLPTVPRFYYFNTSDIGRIRYVLEAVLHDYPDCVFDFTGGRDLLLIVAGAYCFSKGVPCYYIDLEKEQFIDVQGCASLAASFSIPVLRAEDIFAMTGAAITGSGHFAQDLWSKTFEQNILAVWQILQKNIRVWGDFVGWLQTVCASTPTFQLVVPLKGSAGSGGWYSKGADSIMRALEGLGIFRREKRDHGTQLVFKSELYRICLLNIGIWLELFCYVQAKNSGVFDDARTSVVVEWDETQKMLTNTKNEIDVLLTHGVVSLFISCKMSLPTPLALSEIRLLSAKMGGSMSRAVMITAARLNNTNDVLRQRARDMDVLLLDGNDIKNGQLIPELTRLATKPRSSNANYFPAYR